MRINNFTNNMSKKSNKELEHILEEKSIYTDEAIQAVIWEMENRGLIEKKAIESEEVLIDEEIIDKDIPAKILKEDESPFEELQLSILYSKRTIQGFTIFFTTIFGAILLMSNLKEINKPKARTQVLVFGITYTVFSVILLNFLPRMFFITLLFNLIGYAVLVEYFWNKNLGKDLEYRKKKIWKPLIISVLITVALVFIQFLPQMLGE